MTIATTIYTVIPFLSDSITINSNDMRSFNDYDEAYDYASNAFGYFDIVENNLVVKN